MQEMINKILDVKAIDSKQLNLEYEAVNVRLIVNYLIELFSRKAEKKKIFIEWEHLSSNPDAKMARQDGVKQISVSFATHMEKRKAF